jgi:hypothetical protein
MAENQCVKRNVSMNTFVNQILRNYKDWSSLAGSAGFVPLGKDILTLIFQNIEAEKLLDISKQVVYSRKPEEKIMFLKNKFDAEAFFQVLELWLEAGGFPFNHNIIEGDDGTLHNLCMQFNMGSKWSLFVSSHIDNIFRQIGVKKMEFQITDDQVSFEVKP